MNDIVRLWPYVSLAARWEDDRNLNNIHPTDFIETTLKEWHTNSIHHLQIIPIGPDISYLLETDFIIDNNVQRVIIISHLGTDNKQAWKRNIFGTLMGFIRPFYGMNPAFGKAGHVAFNHLKDWFICHPHVKKGNIPIYNVMHSRGVRGIGMSLFFAQLHNIKMQNFAYCVPPIFTRKGMRLAKKYGLDKRTVNIFNEGHLVGKTGFFKYKHSGGNVFLDKSKEWILSNLPIASYAYSAVTNNLKETYKKDNEAVEYLRKRSFVDEC